jgi:hypothetical protein
MYQSDATKFLQGLLKARPELEAQRQALRATWWDKPQDLETQREREASAVPQGPYVYFPLPRAPKP